MDSDNSEERDDLDNFEDSDDTYSGLGAGALDKPVFEEAQFKYAKSMSDSMYLKEITSYIKKQPLTARYKKSLLHCVYALFSEEQVLANNNNRIHSKFIQNDPLGKKLIFAQRDVELSRCDATKYDMSAVNTYALEKYILDVFEAFISRTWGTKIERWINPEISVRNYNQSEVIQSKQAEQPAKKKGFFRRG